MLTILSLAVVMWLGVQAPGTQTPDLAAARSDVYQAALDYVEGVYEVDALKIERSVHPNLTKYGWSRQQTGEYGLPAAMNYQQLLAVAASWNKACTRDLSIKKVEVLDVLDQTAVAKVTAQWGIDYLQLAKYEGTWKIINIVWQSHPQIR